MYIISYIYIIIAWGC